MARNDGKPEIQHYVPQLLLRLHANEMSKHAADPSKTGGEQVYCFDKRTDKQFSTNVKNILSESRFYEIDTGDFVASLEHSLTKVEDDAAPILTRIVEKRTLAGLTNGERQTIAIFTAVQFARTPLIRSTMKEMGEQMIALMKADGLHMPGMPEPGEQDEERLKKASLDLLANSPKTFAPHLLVKHWYLMSAVPEDPFHLGDAPVVRDNDLDGSPSGTLGLASPGVSVYLPLCPTLCLVMMCPGMARYLAETRAQARKGYAKLFLKTIWPQWGKRRLELATPMAELASQYRQMEAKVGGILRGKEPSEYTPEVVMRVNSLQMMQAARWVVSSRNDFSLPKRMIADNDAFRQGMPIKIVRVRPGTDQDGPASAVWGYPAKSNGGADA